MIKQNKIPRMPGVKTGKSPTIPETRQASPFATANDNRTRNNVLQQIALYRLMKKEGTMR